MILGCVPAWADIGVVSEMQGEVHLMRAGAVFVAATGVEVQQGDVVATGSESAAQLDLEDGSVFRIGADTRLDLAQYRLNADRSVIEVGVKLISGWLRFVVAKLKPQAAYKIQAPTLTLGVRGTAGVLESSDVESSLAMDEGEVAVEAAGEAGVAPQIVRAREFIAGWPGARFARPIAVPAAFWDRLPPSLRAPPARRAHLLQRRGVAPQPLRRDKHGAAASQRNKPMQSERGEATAVQSQQLQRQQQRQQQRQGQQQTRQQRPHRQPFERRDRRN